RPVIDRAADRLRVGIDEELGRVAAAALRRLVGAVRAIAVELPGPAAVDVEGEDPGVAADHRQDLAGVADRVVVEAEVDRAGDPGVDREVDPTLDEGGPQRVGPAGASAGHRPHATAKGQPRPGPRGPRRATRRGRPGAPGPLRDRDFPFSAGLVRRGRRWTAPTTTGSPESRSPSSRCAAGAPGGSAGSPICRPSPPGSPTPGCRWS